MYIIKKDDDKGQQLYNQFEIQNQIYVNNLKIIDHLQSTNGEDMVDLLEFINVTYRSDRLIALMALFKHFGKTYDDLETFENIRIDENGVAVEEISIQPDPTLFKLEE